MLRPHSGHLRHSGTTKLGAVGTTGMEGAAGRTANGTWHLPAERDDGPLMVVMQRKDRLQKGLCIGVKSVICKTVAWERLHHHAEIHHHDPVGKGLDQGQIVSDKQDGKLPLLLELHQQFYQLILGGDIQSRGGLIT